MRRPITETVWYRKLYKEINLVSSLILAGVGIKEVAEKWEEEGITYIQMQRFIKYENLTPESVPGVRNIKFNDLSEDKVSLDGSTYCVHKRNCQPYLLLSLETYKILTERGSIKLSDYKVLILKRVNDDNESITAVAKEYGITASYLSIKRKEWMGDDYYPLHGRMLNLHQDDIITRWAEGETISSISRHYDVHHSAIWRSLERWNCFLGY